MNKENIILFDGVCNLCNSTIRFIHHRDSKQQFKYQSLQSEKAKELLKNEGYDFDTLNSFVFLKDGKIFQKSDAALEVAKSLGWPYSFLVIFKIIPKPIRDTVYDFIAKNRYQWFGKKTEVCEYDPTFQEKVL